MKMENNLKFDFNDSTLHISLVGEIDHRSAVRLRNYVDPEIYSRKPKKVIVDLSEVEFRDSSGLGFLMGRHSLIQALRGTLSVVNPNARTLRMIQLAGFDRLIKVEYPDKAEDCGEVPSKVYEDKVSLSQTSEEHMINEMKIQLLSLSVNESVAREVCATFCTQLNPNAEELEDIKSAVSAAVTNCVLHAYTSEIGTIYITVRLCKNRIVRIDIRDEGGGIEDVDIARLPLYTTKREAECSGMGFTLMETLCDIVQVNSKLGDGTTVTLVKRFG
jgi:stage II sporulation protein AB (anti-sigma F factor)